MHRKDRFGPEQHRYWLEQAQPPEDYIYENLSVSRPVRLLRLGLSRWVAAGPGWRGMAQGVAGWLACWCATGQFHQQHRRDCYYLVSCALGNSHTDQHPTAPPQQAHDPALCQ